MKKFKFEFLFLSLSQATRLPDGDALSVLHAMACIGSLLSGTSELHLSPDGTPLPSQPGRQAVEDAVVLLAISEGLVTPHTSAIGVLLQKNPLDPTKVGRLNPLNPLNPLEPQPPTLSP